MDNKKLAELMKDEDFVEKMLTAPTREEAKKLFKEHDLELTDDEMRSIDTTITKTIRNYSKLSDKELENIAGGVSGESIAIGVGVTLLVQAALVTLIVKKGSDILNYMLRNSTFSSSRF